jgi:HlyD family secretion protein
VTLRTVGRGLAILAVVVLVGFGLRATVFAPPPVPVVVHTVKRGTVEQSVTNSRAGTVKARRRAKMSPEEGGRVVTIPKRKGARVVAGEIVLALDASGPRARLELSQRERDAAIAERARACFAAERAGRELARHQRLAKQGIISTDQLDALQSGARTAAASCAAAGANVQRAAAAVTLAESQLDHTILRAPFDGVIADLGIEVGEWSTPSPPGVVVPAVLDIIDTTSLFISAPMDEVDSARIQSGLPARVTLDSYPGQHFAAHVVRVAAYVLDREEQNRTVEIEAELDDRTLATALLPGTSADVEVILATRPDVLRLPAAAVMAGDKVLVVEDDRLVERPVELGLRNWDFVEVTGGVTADTQVVTSLDRPEVRAGAIVIVEQGPGT